MTGVPKPRVAGRVGVHHTRPSPDLQRVDESLLLICYGFKPEKARKNPKKPHPPECWPCG
jgi:hypothetical protein